MDVSEQKELSAKTRALGRNCFSLSRREERILGTKFGVKGAKLGTCV